MFDITEPLGPMLSTMGSHMARERRQNGWVKPTGKKQKKWQGNWKEYVTDPATGMEKRMDRSKILGNCSEMSKRSAQERLRDLLRAQRPPENTAKFRALAALYLKTNAGRWSRKWNDTSV